MRRIGILLYGGIFISSLYSSEGIVTVGGSLPFGEWAKYLGGGANLSLGYQFSLPFLSPVILLPTIQGGFFSPKENTQRFQYLRGEIKGSLQSLFLSLSSSFSIAPYIGGGYMVSSIKTKFLSTTSRNGYFVLGIGAFYRLSPSFSFSSFILGYGIKDKDKILPSAELQIGGVYHFKKKGIGSLGGVKEEIFEE